MNILALALFAVTLAAPQSPAGVALEHQAREIERLLVAPCCWLQPVAEHQSQASDEVKQQIRILLASGKSRQQVLDAFVAQYGSRILAERLDEELRNMD